MCVASVPPILADVVLYSRRSGVAWLGMQAGPSKIAVRPTNYTVEQNTGPLTTITPVPETSLNADRLSQNFTARFSSKFVITPQRKINFYHISNCRCTTL